MRDTKTLKWRNQCQESIGVEAKQPGFGCLDANSTDSHAKVKQAAHPGDLPLRSAAALARCLRRPGIGGGRGADTPSQADPPKEVKTNNGAKMRPIKASDRLRTQETMLNKRRMHRDSEWTAKKPETRSEHKKQC